MEPELRFAPFQVDEGRVLTGTALRYGDTSLEHRERFEPLCFGELRPLPLNLQHDSNIVLVPADQVELIDTDTALQVRAALPESKPQRWGVASLVRRGALKGLSVEFHPREFRMEGDIRVITRAELVGIGLVDRPSYPGSKVAVRASVAHGEGPLKRVWL